MWWTIPLVMIVLFIFVGKPLILDYRAAAKESSINERNNKKIIFINAEGIDTNKESILIDEA